jgi:hypothetical protein
MTLRVGLGIGQDCHAAVYSGTVPYSVIVTDDNELERHVAAMALPTMRPQGGGETSIATFDGPTFPAMAHRRENCSVALVSSAGYRRAQRTLLAT